MNEGMENLKEIETLKKENNELAKMIDITREEAQVIQLQADNEVRKFTKRIADLEDVNKSHQKLNGELRELLRETVKELSNAKDLNKSHQKLNGQLQEKLSKYEDKAAHYRRKAVL